MSKGSDENKKQIRELRKRQDSLGKLSNEYEKLSGEVKNFVEDACDVASWINETFEGTDSETGKRILNYLKSLIMGHDNEHLKQMTDALEYARGVVRGEEAAVREELERLNVNIGS